MKFNANKVIGFLGRVLDGYLKSQKKTDSDKSSTPTTTPLRRPSSGSRPSSKARPAGGDARRGPSRSPQGDQSTTLGWENGNYPGDFRGAVKPVYNPESDGRPDPGEIVWAWVPYEEDYSQGKDRPVLLIGTDGDYLLALMLTSKDRSNAEHRDQDYVDIGSGPWDKQGRPSEVKVDRVIRLRESGIRREGAVLGRQHFARVADRLTSR